MVHGLSFIETVRGPFMAETRQEYSFSFLPVVSR